MLSPDNGSCLHLLEAALGGRLGLQAQPLAWGAGWGAWIPGPALLTGHFSHARHHANALPKDSSTLQKVKLFIEEIGN